MLKKAKWEAETSGGEDGVKEMAEEENEVCGGSSGTLLPYVVQGRCGGHEELVQRVMVNPSYLEEGEERENSMIELNGRKALEAPPITSAEGVGEVWGGGMGGRDLATRTWTYTEFGPNGYDGDSSISLPPRYPFVTISSPPTSSPPINLPPQNLMLHNPNHHHLMPPHPHPHSRRQPQYNQYPPCQTPQHMPSITPCGGIIRSTNFPHTRCCCHTNMHCFHTH